MNKIPIVDFDVAEFRRIAAEGHFTPARDPRELIQRYRRLGERGTPLGFGVSCVAQSIGVELLQHFGSPAQREKYFPKLTSAQWIAGIANTEATGGTDLKSMSARINVGPGGARLTARKNCFTNGPSDLIFVSAWAGDAAAARLDVFLIEGHQVTQTDLHGTFPGFRSGRTGSLAIEDLPVNLDEARLGRAGRGSDALKFCFDLERLMISALIHGMILNAEAQFREFVKSRTASGRNLADHPWVQDKGIELRRVQLNLRGLLELCANDFQGTAGLAPGLRALNPLLSLLKWQAIEDGINALTAAFEAEGVRSLMQGAPLLERLNDLYHLKFLGGTKELQKIFLWQELDREIKEAEHEQIRTAQKTG